MIDESSPLRRPQLSPRQRAILAKYTQVVALPANLMPHQFDVFVEAAASRDRAFFMPDTHDKITFGALR